MESKSFSLKALDEKGSGSAVVATLDVVDRDGDVIRPGAFGSQHVAVLPAHDSRVVPLGKAVLSEKGNEAIAAFTLNQEIQSGKDWTSHLKRDLEQGEPIQQWSFRFDVLKESFGAFGDNPKVRFLEELKVWEVSPVLVGAGVNTRTLEAKAAKDKEAARRQAEEQEARMAAEKEFIRHERARAEYAAMR